MKENEINEAAEELIKEHLGYTGKFEDSVSKKVQQMWFDMAGKEAAKHAIITVTKQIEDLVSIPVNVHSAMTLIATISKMLTEKKAILENLKNRLK